MSRLGAAWAGWVRLLDRREPGDAMALLRVAVGLIVFVTLLSLATSGLVGVIWLDRADGGYAALGRMPHLVRWLGGPTPRVVWGLVVTGIGGGALLALGLGGRLTALVVLQVCVALHRLNSDVSGSADIVVMNALWLLVLSRSTATLSLDCRLRTGRFRSDEQIPAYPRYLGLLQLTLIYGTTGLQKLSVHWLPMSGFSALYYILQQPSWQRFDMTWAARVYPLTQLATAVTWLFEITAPLLLLVYYYRRTAARGGRLRRLCNRFDLRLSWVATGLALHAVIWATMEVGAFSQIMVSLYVCLFHPSELRAAGRWAQSKLRRGRAPTAPGMDLL